MGPEIHGKVTGMDLEEKTIWIDNVPYLVNSGVLLKMEDKYLRLGESAQFYKNNRGVIVHYLIDKTLEYGFATQAAKTGTLVEQYQIKFLDSLGRWKVLSFADKVRFNGERALTAITSEQVLREKIGSIYNGSAEMQGSDIVINKVIGYEVNGKNEIDKLYGIPNKLNYESEFGYGWETSEVYDAVQGLYAGKYITDQTVLFSTSKQPTSKIPLEQSEVFVNRKEALTDKKAYDLLLYNIDTNDRIFAISGVGLFEENLKKESTLSQVQYGFATAIGKNGGIAPNYQLRILDSDGRWANLSFAQVFFNGEDIAVNSGKENLGEILADKIGNLDNSGPAVENANGIYPVNKVFSYQTNQDGLLEKLCLRPGNELNVREISGIQDGNRSAWGCIDWRKHSRFQYSRRRDRYGGG